MLLQICLKSGNRSIGPTDSKEDSENRTQVLSKCTQGESQAYRVQQWLDFCQKCTWYRLLEPSLHSQPKMDDIVRTFCSEDGFYMHSLSKLYHELGNLRITYINSCFKLGDGNSPVIAQHLPADVFTNGSRAC